MRIRIDSALKLVAWGLLMAIPITGVARADDLAPPSYRGMPLGVEGHWDTGDGTTFQASKVHVYNRIVPNPNESVWPAPPTITTSDGATYVVTFPDWVDNEPLKLGRIQLYWITSDPSIFPSMNPSAFPGDGVIGFDGGNTNPGVVFDPVPITGGIYGAYFDFQIRPNPNFETITFTFFGATGGPVPVQLQEVDIDTVSIPEPASAAIGLAALPLLRRRRES
ncbi:MAG TPA: hypothetical protein VG722_06915 [Tepidisphaeraceae bacterium]|nr:hypothetical protein [Tepidisphaeraceae bacterium]